MDKPLKRIASILIIIVLLPALFITISELTSINSDEELIEEIYKNQLEAIIYSVNQYSQDYVTTWSSEISSFLFESRVGDQKLDEKIEKFLKEKNSIVNLFLSPLSLDYNIFFRRDGEKIVEEENQVEVQNILSENQKIISRLVSFEATGYKKIEPLVLNQSNSYSLLTFVTQTDFDENMVCGLFINTTTFIENVLAPKIQEISRDNIIISCYDKRTNQRIYSNLPLEEENFQKEGPLWLFPNYSLSISLKGRTIEGLVKQRSVTNILVMGLITLVLIVGVIFVYRNIKREIEFAQIKSEFVSNVSHELRTPLALISMFAETLELNRVKTEEKKQEYYTIISQETNRLSRIVNTILNFSKMEAGKREYHFEKNDLNDVLNEVLKTYKFHLNSKGFSLKLNLTEKPLPVSIDKEAVSESIINIIDNAIKYSTDRKEIEIATGLKNKNAYISVRDFGVGISEDDQKRIFDKFFRVSSGLVHNTKGTGMGLSIVKHVVEAHKGNVSIKSKINEGSTFEINIPLS